MTASNYMWKTAGIIRETKEAVTVIFETGETAFEYKAGQYVNVRINIEGVEFIRSYYLSSCPDGDEKPAITVKRVEGGIVSNYIVDNAEDIHDWNITGPLGTFCIEEESDAKHFVLIAGGSGITRLYSMIKHLIKNTDAYILLVYCNRTLEDVIYSKVLNYLENSFPDRFSVYNVLSRAGDGSDFTSERHIKGRMSKLVLKKILKKVAPQQSENVNFFLCGPMGLIELSEETIKALYVNPQR
jgi:ring-1,2-phenylacetyl-CoA epoxidase subunit PaaE